MTPEETGLTPDELRRYARHLSLPGMSVEGQRKLKAASALVVGAGGLGSPAALYLAAAGIGRLGLVDFDTVDVANLQRQILYGTGDVGRPKVDSARARLEDLNPFVRIETWATKLTSRNAREILGNYDVVVDGSDNLPTRYLTNDACVLLGKPYIYGAVFRFEGQASVFDSARGPCYRCLYPEPPPPGLVPSCAEAGVLGVLPGIVGTIQAAETLKVLLGLGDILIGRLLLFDALAMTFRELRVGKDPACPVCGPRATIRDLIDYERFCCASPAGSAADGSEMPPRELRRRLNRGDRLVILDVRESWERSLNEIAGSRWMSLDELPGRMNELSPADEIVAYCKSGGRSAEACDMLRRAGFPRVWNLAGGINAWAADIDPKMPRY